MQICQQCFQTNTACAQCGGHGIKTDASLQPIALTKDIRLFATDAFPLHASAIPELIKCEWKAAMLHLFGEDYSSGEAADTGSLTHVGVASWHREKDITKAIQEMRDAESRYPQGNLAEATQLFFLYSRDPRNRDAETPLIEHKSRIEITPAKTDPTQAPICIVGTVDQVRVIDGRWWVYDLKTSKRPGLQQLNMYLYQIAAYALMISNEFKRPVGLGGLLTPRFYKDQPPEEAPPGVVFKFPHKFNDIGPLINGIRFAVAAVRSGYVHPSPGEHCTYCPQKSTGDCIPLLRSISDHEQRIKTP